MGENEVGGVSQVVGMARQVGQKNTELTRAMKMKASQISENCESVMTESY